MEGGFLSIEIPIYRFFPWCNNLTAYELVQLEPAVILEWQPNKQAQAPV